MYACISCLSLLHSACTGPALVQKTENKRTPAQYNNSGDTLNTAKIKWREFFKDPYLAVLIDTALKNNQELNTIFRIKPVPLYLKVH